jgi:GntR family transcriptional regulator
LLGISQGAPVLHIQRLTFSRDGTPFEYTESIYRGDKHFFRIELRNEYDESHRR